MKHKRKLNKGKVLLVIIIGVLLIYSFHYAYRFLNEFIDFSHIFSENIDSAEYTVIKEDKNTNYLGVGQESVKNRDGYFTIFTTKNNRVFKEYKQNSGSWKNNTYWNDKMKESGCGITAMSIILSGYNIDITPEDLRNKYYPVLEGENMAGELRKYGVDNTDFYFDNKHLSTESLKNHLETNRPILICVWNKNFENRWTTTSHYMVLLASDGDDKVYISNPNGGENDSKSSGWYQYSEIQPYIAKAMYIKDY